MTTYCIEPICDGPTSPTQFVQADTPEAAIKLLYPNARIFKNLFPAKNYYEEYGANPSHICHPSGSVSAFDVTPFTMCEGL